MDPNASNQYRSVLRAATERLRHDLANAPAGSGETPYLDAVVLLSHAASMTTEQVLAAFDDPVPDHVRSVFNRHIDDRCGGLPVSYIRGMKEFYGREFAVGPGVLVPRPDTEVLVEEVVATLGRLGGGDTHVHDCCTGSGCVGITISCESHCRVTASDLSEQALRYALRNAKALGVPTIDIWRGDLLTPLHDHIGSGEVSPAQIIAANPPYVTDNEVDHLAERGWPEPVMALAGGIDGLGFVRRLVDDAPDCLTDGGWLMVEIGSDQGPATAALFAGAGYGGVALVQDLAGHDRVCRGQWFRA